MATAAAGTVRLLRPSQWVAPQQPIASQQGMTQSAASQQGKTQSAASQHLHPVPVRCASSRRGRLSCSNSSVPAEDEVIKAEVLSAGPAPAPVERASAIFLADVANLIKLVNSRDIVELELKNGDYELLIRKKEAIPPPPAIVQATYPGPHIQAHTFAPPYPSPLPSISPPAEETGGPAPVEAAPATPPASSYPPMLSPMAGTFYRSPGPNDVAFVKVGDKIQKGQVVCIVEAMKLMNEIEADQSGTIVEIVAEDGKPVSIETPLFVIKP